MIYHVDIVGEFDAPHCETYVSIMLCCHRVAGRCNQCYWLRDRQRTQRFTLLVGDCAQQSMRNNRCAALCVYESVWAIGHSVLTSSDDCLPGSLMVKKGVLLAELASCTCA